MIRSTHAPAQVEADRPASNVLMSTLLPALTAALATVAGVIHLAHNYLPMEGPPSGSGGPPPGAGDPAAGPGGLMSLVMPHLTEVFILNFLAFVGLALVLVVWARTRPVARVTVDLLLAVLSAATLYAWNAMGRANPAGTGTLALITESALLVLAVADAIWLPPGWREQRASPVA
jgi:hypothetical protein